MNTAQVIEMYEHTAVVFDGGDERGMCLRITGKETGQAIEATMEEGARLVNALTIFVRDEALRRQDLLRKQIQDRSIYEGSVFAEVANLDPSLLEVPLCVVTMISKWCPKSLIHSKLIEGK